jgi:hypothetical protein
MARIQVPFVREGETLGSWDVELQTMVVIGSRAT